MDIINCFKTIKTHKKKENDDNFKLKNIDDELLNEAKISNLISKIPNYHLFFIVIENLNDLTFCNNKSIDVRNSNYKVVKYSSNKLFTLDEKLNNYSGSKKIHFLITLVESGFNLIKILHQHNIIHNCINSRTILISKNDYCYLSDFSLSFLTNNSLDTNLINRGLVPQYYREILCLKSSILDELQLNNILDSLTRYFKNCNLLEENELLDCINNYKLFLEPFLNIDQKQIINDFNNLLFSWDFISFSFLILSILNNYNCTDPLTNIRKLFINMLSPPWDKNINIVIDQFKNIYLNTSSSLWESLIKLNI